MATRPERSDDEPCAMAAPDTVAIPASCRLRRLVVLATAVSIYLRSLVPLDVGGSPYDEGLYVRLATARSQGDWLGPFTKVTLSKNPSYAGFVAAMHQIGLPLKIGEHITYLLAAAAFAGCVWICTRRPGLTTAAYVILALRPESFARLDASVLRDGWNARWVCCSSP